MKYFSRQDECIEAIVRNMPTKTIKAIYLTGSYANGTNNENSDVDLIVVSNCFTKISGYLRRKIVLSNIDINYPKIDVVCLTEQEFDKYKNSKAYKNESLILLFGGDL